MTWAPLFLIFLHHLTGSYAQFVLTQPKSVSESLGRKVTSSCKHSSGNIASEYVHWYQQHFGTSPKTVIYLDDERPSGFPDRFSGSIDSSSYSASLAITDLQIERETTTVSPMVVALVTVMRIMGRKTKTLQSSSCGIICDKEYCYVCLLKKYSYCGTFFNNFL